MALRSRRARSTEKSDPLGVPQLTFAQLLVRLEHVLRLFALPLMLVGGFVAFAWLGLFTGLYPFVHIAALIIFAILFCEALGRARASWQPVSPSEARRRVEEASQLKHRPFDVLEDRPSTADEEQLRIWQAHVTQARDQLQNLRWPKWNPVFEGRDPYALRYALLILLVLGAVFGWGTLGGRLIAALNPALGRQLHLEQPTLDAWITPPEYTGLPPIMIATPAGLRHDRDVIDVPEGSIISAHLAVKNGSTPTLLANDTRQDFTPTEHEDFEARQVITSGETISIRHGWQSLGSWSIRVVPDQAPHITLTEPPSSTERKSVRLAYEASDDYGVASISVRVTPRESLPGISNDPIELPLAEPQSKEVKRASFEDLTAHPWAGLPVQIQLIATDAVGHKAVSAVADFTLPERFFFQPVARALIEERKKLLQHPEDESIRNQTANVMAGIAHEPADYHGDPVILMSLRAGAVRLVLDQSREATASVDDLLWQSAVRIEDGATGVAEQNLRQVEKDLADALDRNASEQDIQRLIDRMHQALAQYLAELSMRMAQRPGPVEDLSQMMGDKGSALTPQDLEHMLEQMRNMSAAGARDGARQELAKLQQMLENLRTGQPQVTAEQRAEMQALKALRELTQNQRQLLDKTFQDNEKGDKQDARKLADQQNDLLRRLRELMGPMKGSHARELGRGAEAMQGSDTDLKGGELSGAMTHQNEALKAMQQAEQAIMDDLRQSMMLLPHPGMDAMGENGDPFGRDYGSMFRDDGGVKVPDQMEVRRVREILNELQRRAGDANRSKTERDYIDRLLQNF